MSVSGRFGERAVELGTRRIPARATVRFTARFVLEEPKLWSPRRPYLYDVSLAARARAGKQARRSALPAAQRGALDPRRGRAAATSTARAMSFRGVGYHEDSREQGFAIDNAVRDRLVAETKALGATLMRTHYPPIPTCTSWPTARGSCCGPRSRSTR